MLLQFYYLLTVRDEFASYTFFSLMYGMGLIHKIEGPKKRCYLPNPSCTEILIKGTFFFFGGQLFHVVTEI